MKTLCYHSQNAIAASSRPATVTAAGVRIPATPNTSTMLGTHPNQPSNNQMKKQDATAIPNIPTAVRNLPFSAWQSNTDNLLYRQAKQRTRQ